MIEVLASIKDALGANITDMAGILGVSRQTVYVWLAGGGMSPDSRHRVEELSKAALVFKDAGLEPNSYWLNRPIVNGKSFVAIPHAECYVFMAARLCDVMIRERVRRDWLVARLAAGGNPISEDS